MNPPTWKAFVIQRDETTYTIISEHDKKLHTLQQPIPEFTRLEDGALVHINPIILENSRLFSACREYIYDVDRKQRRYEVKKQERKLKDQEKATKKSETVNYVI